MEKEQTQPSDPQVSPEQEEIIQEKKQNRKIDISLVISTLALIITTFQFIVTTPFFTDYYYDSSFEVEETFPYLNGQSVTSNFVIKNTSKNTVNSIEIGIQMLAGDVITIAPNRNIQLTYKENGPNLKDCFFTIDKLVPNENIFVLVHSNFDTLMRYNKDFLAGGAPIPNELDTNNTKPNGIESKHLLFPNILLAKFDKGFGKINRLPKEILLNHKNAEIDTPKNNFR